MKLFETTGQAAGLVERVLHQGERVQIAATPGGRVLFRTMAMQLPGSVIVRVGREADAHTHALLSAATQCGPSIAAEVASHLRHGESIGGALSVLKDALHGRRLLVAGLGALRNRDDLAKVFARTRLSVYRALHRRADVTMAFSGIGFDPQQAQAITPVDSTHWDAQRVWQKCGNDVDRYEAVAALYLGGELQGNTVPDLEAAVGALWLSLPAPLRDLVGVLWVHRRPLPRPLVERAQLAKSKIIEAALRRHLIHDTRGELTLPAYWLAARDAVSLEAPEVHKRIAAALGPLSHDAAWGPLATLEAHRHYAEIPDLVRASEYAAFGVEMLLDLGRRMSMAERWQHAISAYQAVQTLGDKAGGVVLGARARAYAVHYEAYNRYKAAQEPIDRTIERYREALTGWRDNALFWSRLIAAYFVAGRPADAMREIARAYAAVPKHDERDHLLTCRTVNRLLERDRVMEAALAWVPSGPMTPLLEETRHELVTTWTESPPMAIWSAAAGLIELTAPACPSLAWRDGVWEMALLDRSGRGRTPGDAMDQLIEVLRAELERAVTEVEVEVERRDALVAALLLPRASDQESVRWVAMLAELVRAELRDELNGHQRKAALSLWVALRHRHPGLRRPAVRISMEQTIQLAWSYAEPSGFMFTVEIDRDGKLDWYLRDPLRLEGEASEDPVDALPPAVIDRLEAVAR